MIFDYIWQHTNFYVALTFVVTLLVVYLLHLKSSRTHLPSGPFGVPFLGSVPFVGSRADLTFGKWADKYGPVMYLKMGMQPTVILSSYEAVQQTFIKQSAKFNGRITNSYTKEITENSGVIFCNELDKWKIYRKFGHKVLGNSELLGGGIEKAVKTEAENLCELIRNKAGPGFILEGHLNISIGDVLLKILTGETISDSSYKNMKTMFDNVLYGFQVHRVAYLVFLLFPWARLFPPFSKHFKLMLEEKKMADDLMQMIIKDHMKDFDPNHYRDLIDLYLDEMKQQKFGFDVGHLSYFLKDLIAAGVETSATTIRWILFHLITYPEIQEKVHKEIDQVIGRNGCVSNRAELHYTRAVIQEVFRCKAAVPLSIPRRTTEDVQFMGFTIPKNTQVIANIWKVHQDPATWTNPHIFDPERHLDENGRFIKSNKIMPFSDGQRNCLGKHLAMTEIFLFVVTILQRFKVCTNPGNEKPSLEGILGVVYYPKKFPMLFEER